VPAYLGGAPAYLGGVSAYSGGPSAYLGGASAYLGGVPGKSGGAPAFSGGVPSKSGGAWAFSGGVRVSDSGVQRKENEPDPVFLGQIGRSAVLIGRDITPFVGPAFRQLREQAGLSQEALALEACLDRTYVSGIERGRRNPSLKSMQRLAEQLDLSLDKVFALASALAREEATQSGQRRRRRSA
jgi:DNA-binding XRE family transcriptional regulator